MGDSAHLNGLAVSLTDVLSALILLVVGILALLCFGLYWAVHRYISGSPASAIREVEAALKRLPSRVCDEFKDESCCICLEPFKSGELIRKLQNCKHEFHQTCVDAWLLKTATAAASSSIRANHGPSCPLCKRAAFSAATLHGPTATSRARDSGSHAAPPGGRGRDLWHGSHFPPRLSPLRRRPIPPPIP
jgi:hypothetical protein